MSPQEKQKTSEYITENDLNLTEDISAPEDAQRPENRQRIYAEDERKVERALEQAGERIKQTGSSGKSVVSRKERNEISEKAKEISLMDANEQVEHLVQIAINKSPYLALQIARHLEDNYVLAELHSDLTEDSVYNILVEKGLLK